MNLFDAMQAVNWDELIDALNAYAISRLKSDNIKNFEGKEAIDFVGDVILKVMEGKRDWNKAQCSFREFLFGCLRSEISNFFETSKKCKNGEFEENSTVQNTENIEDNRKQISELLKLKGADDDELTVFECWMDGIKKPRDIAEDLGVNVKEIYNISKRLEKRIEKIKTLATQII